MPSLKREAKWRGKAAANTGLSADSEGRANSPGEETDEPARGSGSLHICKMCAVIISVVRKNYIHYCSVKVSFNTSQERYNNYYYPSNNRWAGRNSVFCLENSEAH
ncbi:hypothetical protein T4A_7379 [Trichinella pseudospiralis]|uniref:Uncharacterized protein n=1 Tax=Trichinella pseudospiralis TaxID=6337 RepID=A0A0V1ETB4_TRIPS|nr:hypothetical protein T4A_7379 [Trichinella pseudospiralis]